METGTKEIIPQVGTTGSGESHPGPSPGCPTYSGGGKDPRFTVARPQEGMPIMVGPKEANDEEEDPKVKRAKTRESKPQSVREPLTLVVVAEDFPTKRLDMAAFFSLQELLTTRLEESPHPLPILKLGRVVIGGAINVICSDSMAALWVRANVEGVSLGGTRVKVVDANDITDPVKMLWKTRNRALADTDRALKLLKLLNPSIRTDRWTVVSLLKETHQFSRVVLMDRVSSALIENSEYRLRGGIERYVFKLLDDGRKVEDAQSVANEVAETSPVAGELPEETVVEWRSRFRLAEVSGCDVVSSSTSMESNSPRESLDLSDSSDDEIGSPGGPL